MTTLLISADAALFHRVNAVWTCSWLDAAMPFLTRMHRSPVVFAVVVPCLAALWLRLRGRRALWMIGALAVTVGLADLASYRVVKPLVHRSRPEFVEKSVVLRAGSVSGYGFPSNHATNAFAVASMLGSLEPLSMVPALTLAAAIAYSRVYVGVHYPLDVLGGALFGAMMGLAGAAAYRRWGP